MHNAREPHTCTSDPQQPCDPCTAAYLRVKRAIEEADANDAALIAALERQEAVVCSCGNRFDGDNLCMSSACEQEV